MIDFLSKNADDLFNYAKLRGKRGLSPPRMVCDRVHVTDISTKASFSSR